MRERLRREHLDASGVGLSDYLGTEDVVFLEPLQDPIRLPSGQGVNVTTMRMMLDRAPRDADGHITFTDPYREKVLSTRNAADLAQLQEWKEIADYNGPWPGGDGSGRVEPHLERFNVPVSEDMPFFYTVQCMMIPPANQERLGRSEPNSLEEVLDQGSSPFRLL